MSENLFSYGTLQNNKVQFALFGRALHGSPDILEGYRVDAIGIKDEAFLSKGEQQLQRIAVLSGNNTDMIEGTVFELSPEELQLADQYEPVDYKRILVKLRSGKEAWVYAAVDDHQMY